MWNKCNRYMGHSFRSLFHLERDAVAQLLFGGGARGSGNDKAGMSGTEPNHESSVLAKHLNQGAVFGGHR
jgi:hypothetical protein